MAWRSWPREPSIANRVSVASAALIDAIRAPVIACVTVCTCPSDTSPAARWPSSNGSNGNRRAADTSVLACPASRFERVRNHDAAVTDPCAA